MEKHNAHNICKLQRPYTALSMVPVESNNQSATVRVQLSATQREDD